MYRNLYYIDRGDEMETLKWLLSASLMIAFMFLGLKVDPKKDNQDGEKSQNSALVRILG